MVLTVSFGADLGVRSTAAHWHDGQFTHDAHARFARPGKSAAQENAHEFAFEPVTNVTSVTYFPLLA